MSAQARGQGSTVMGRLGKVVHVEGGYTVVEILDDAPGQAGAILGYSLFGVGTDIRKLYSLEAAQGALRERLETTRA